jgi:hypothetical protein
MGGGPPGGRPRARGRRRRGRRAARVLRGAAPSAAAPAARRPAPRAEQEARPVAGGQARQGAGGVPPVGRRVRPQGAGARRCAALRRQHACVPRGPRRCPQHEVGACRGNAAAARMRGADADARRPMRPPSAPPCRPARPQDVEKLAAKKGVVLQSVKEVGGQQNPTGGRSGGRAAGWTARPAPGAGMCRGASRPSPSHGPFAARAQVLQSLVDDDLVHSEKIGISNYFWWACWKGQAWCRLAEWGGVGWCARAPWCPRCSGRARPLARPPQSAFLTRRLPRCQVVPRGGIHQGAIGTGASAGCRAATRRLRLHASPLPSARPAPAGAQPASPSITTGRPLTSSPAAAPQTARPDRERPRTHQGDTRGGAQAPRRRGGGGGGGQGGQGGHGGAGRGSGRVRRKGLSVSRPQRCSCRGGGRRAQQAAPAATGRAACGRSGHAPQCQPPRVRP